MYSYICGQLVSGSGLQIWCEAGGDTVEPCVQQPVRWSNFQSYSHSKGVELRSHATEGSLTPPFASTATHEIRTKPMTNYSVVGTPLPNTLSNQLTTGVKLLIAVTMHW